MSSNRYNDGSKRASSNIDSQILQQFLSSNVDCMDANTIVQILSSHDVAASECTEYAARSGDIGTAVNAAFCMSDSVVRIISFLPSSYKQNTFIDYLIIILLCDI